MTDKDENKHGIDPIEEFFRRGPLWELLEKNGIKMKLEPIKIPVQYEED
jgi:hypothetical protein